MMTACERLTYAEKRLKEKGWMQGNFRKRVEGKLDHTGPACLLGALVTDEELDEGVAVVNHPGVRLAMQAMGFTFSYDVWGWNDATGRTIGDVLTRINTGKEVACKETK